jgi:hypothetical protein
MRFNFLTVVICMICLLLCASCAFSSGSFQIGKKGVQMSTPKFTNGSVSVGAASLGVDSSGLNVQTFTIQTGNQAAAPSSNMQAPAATVITPQDLQIAPPSTQNSPPVGTQGTSYMNDAERRTLQDYVTN